LFADSFEQLYNIKYLNNALQTKVGDNENDEIA